MSRTLLLPNTDEFQAHLAPIKMVRFSPSGRLMATGDTELQIRIWDKERELLHIDSHSLDDKIRPTENIRGIEFSADEKHVYVCASDTLDAYGIDSKELEWQYRAPRHFGFLIVSPQAIAVGPNGTVAASFDYGSMAAFSPNGELVWRRHENYAPRRIAFANECSEIIGGDSFNICIWDAETGAMKNRQRLIEKTFSMAVIPEEGLVVTRELHSLSVFETKPFNRAFQIPAGRGLPCIAVSHSQQLIASGEHHRIRMVNFEGQGVRDIHVEEATVLSVAFTPDGVEIVAGCSDGHVRRWRVD